MQRRPVTVDRHRRPVSSHCRQLSNPPFQGRPHVAHSMRNQVETAAQPWSSQGRAAAERCRSPARATRPCPTCAATARSAGRQVRGDGAAGCRTNEAALPPPPAANWRRRRWRHQVVASGSPSCWMQVSGCGGYAINIAAVADSLKVRPLSLRSVAGALQRRFSPAMEAPALLTCITRSLSTRGTAMPPRRCKGGTT